LPDWSSLEEQDLVLLGFFTSGVNIIDMSGYIGSEPAFLRKLFRSRLFKKLSSRSEELLRYVIVASLSILWRLVLASKDSSSKLTTVMDGPKLKLAAFDPEHSSFYLA
jgi:hypothetical protein